MSCVCECGEPRRPNPCGCPCQCDCGCRPEENRPGLDTVAFGDDLRYDAVFRRMRERLSSDDLPALAALTARATDETIDPALALLDGWACLSEILSFYNERVVNECFLRTCLERRSAVEIARLVGYAPRPGVAADAYLAFTLDDTDKDAVLQVPTGTRAYSQPAPGETMQPFETDEPLTGRPRWSLMRPRLTTPQVISNTTAEVWFKGITTGLSPGDVLLFDTGNPWYGRTVRAVEPIPKGSDSRYAPILEDLTRVVLQASDPPPNGAADSRNGPRVPDRLLDPPGRYARSRAHLNLEPEEVFPKDSDGNPEDSYALLNLLGAAHPQLRGTLAQALAGTAPAGPIGTVTAYAMRVKAAIHGHNAPLIPELADSGRITGYDEWDVDGTLPDDGNSDRSHDDNGSGDPGLTLIALDAVYDGILPGSHVAILIPSDGQVDGGVAGLKEDRVFTVEAVNTISVTGFNMPARVTQLQLNTPWRPTNGTDELTFSRLRQTVVYAQSDALTFADQPMDEPVPGVLPGGDVDNESLVLDGFYPGIEPGRRLIVTGERTDLDDVSGVRAAELVMVKTVVHKKLADDERASRDTIHTYLTLAEPGLTYTYKRNTVAIHGNVAHASHGESRAEVLGSGDASRALQEFPVKQSPLTYVPAPTAAGVESTLEVRVNNLRWREAPNAAAITPDDRRYILRTDDDAKTTVITGLGSRLPTGRDNVVATYRSGIGAEGNVQAGQISVLASQPHGVMGVTNPLASSGGADRDDLTGIRTRAPIGLAALDRLVSASDFEDFTRAFAGIGKAKVRLDGPANCAVLTITIAGENDTPLSEDSALIHNLTEALIRLGDLQDSNETISTRNVPPVTVEIQIREASLIALRGRVRIHADELWEAVLPRIQAALVSRLGFQAREIGQDADPGAAIAAIQNVRGVTAVDLQGFGTIDAGSVDLAGIAQKALAALNHDPSGVPEVTSVDDHTIAYLAPDATGTLLLSHWTGE